MKAVFLNSGPLTGELRVPGDKSISHRAALVSAVSRGTASIRNYSPAADCARTLEVLGKLGVNIDVDAGGLVVEGRGGTGFVQPSVALDAGNSGTTARLLTGILASMPLTVTLIGDSSLRRRPMRRIIEPLEMMGARITCSDEYGYLPLVVEGSVLRGIDYTPPVASAQVKSAVLLAGMMASGLTRVRESVKTRDHTERMLRAAGVPVRVDGLEVTVGPGVPVAMRLDIPGDISSAAFFIAAAALVPGSEIGVRSVGMNPARVGFLDTMRRMGADITVELDADEWEPSGTVRAVHAPLKAVNISAEEVALAIDEVTLLALVATGASGRTVIRGAQELRHKESDRIANTVRELKKMGALIEETPDGIEVEGPVALAGAEVSAGGDHRIAMMLAVAGLIASGRTVVRGWEWTAVSYPGFERELRRLGAKVES